MIEDAAGSAIRNGKRHDSCLLSTALAHVGPAETSKSIIVLEENNMWTKPDFTEMRFGFEITMYIGNR